MYLFRSDPLSFLMRLEYVVQAKIDSDFEDMYLISDVTTDHDPTSSLVHLFKMNVEKLMKMAGAVRTGGKGSVRRKKKAVHKTTSVDGKRLQDTLKRLGVNGISQIEEITIFKDDTVIQFLNPKVQASIPANTWVVSGTPQTKRGPESFRKLAEQFQKQASGVKAGEATTAGMSTIQEDDDEVPELVAGETFEAAAEEGQKS
ncbi:hypothetical protein E3N88_34115 [Mikania micrantha]|uniref:Nascent polypeptide-associated complex subunit beta n=1 Tax=Mikania micrantha TaxID=192012 RepID=A0A5N6MDB6_9ASTR|nr:hypothetical protein E3N88_34115 [Mikania micrantha]